MKYDVILADPPWQFRVWNRDTGTGRSAESYYSTMSIDELCALSVANVTADNCALFMWCCWPSLPEALEVIKAWGFTYKTLGFEWWKLNKRWHSHYLPLMPQVDSYSILNKLFHFGMGYYSRANSEPCILAIRGSMPVASRAERNFIIAPIREHSQKPLEQYSKIEALYPEAHKVELFARQKQPGWDAIGNEIDGKSIEEVLCK